MSGALPRTADTPDKLVRRSAHRGIVLRYDKKASLLEGGGTASAVTEGVKT